MEQKGIRASKAQTLLPVLVVPMGREQEIRGQVQAMAAALHHRQRSRNISCQGNCRSKEEKKANEEASRGKGYFKASREEEEEEEDEDNTEKKRRVKESWYKEQNFSKKNCCFISLYLFIIEIKLLLFHFNNLEKQRLYSGVYLAADIQTHTQPLARLS